MRPLVVLGATAATMLAVAASGCGGGGGDGGEGRLSKEEYASKANAICADFNQKVKDAGPEPQRVKDIPPYVDKVKPLFEDGLSELKELKPPEDEQETADEWLDSAGRQIDLLDEIKGAAEDNDLGKVREVGDEIEATNKKTEALARELGATTCTES